MELLEGASRPRALSIVAFAAVLVATLWPMNPFPQNGVSWLQGKNGIQFEKEGLVISRGPLHLPAASDAQSYTLELFLRPATFPNASTILGFYNPAAPEQLVIRQMRSGVGLAQDSETEHDRINQYYLGRGFQRGRTAFIAISSGLKGITFYMDDQRSKFFPGLRISPSQLSGDIVLGAAPITYQPWIGELQGLAIYAKELTDEGALEHYQAWTHPDGHRPDLDDALARYTFSEGAGTAIRNQVVSEPNLEIPPTFSVPHKAFLRSPGKEFQLHWRYALDIVSNIAGFVPLGLIVCSYLQWTRPQWKAAILTVVSCGLFSLTIEVVQFYIPRRGSGVTDVITNTLGAALGVCLLHIPLVQWQLERMGLARPGE